MCFIRIHVPRYIMNQVKRSQIFIKYVCIVKEYINLYLI